ncbi:uncharacterized protein TNCV_2822501 [Trichonephila clavipes]|nr:uncharacterized protein TNCV_2822501 [Trichonephila clavipes]
MYCAFAVWGYSIQPSSRKSSREVGGRGREVRAFDNAEGVPPQNLGGTELNCTVTCMVLRPTKGVHLDPCHDEFRGSDAVVIRWHEEQQHDVGSNPGEGMSVCKCIVPSQHGGLNRRQAASPLVRLVEGEERWKASERPQGVLSQNWDIKEPKGTFT